MSVSYESRNLVFLSQTALVALITSLQTFKAIGHRRVDWVKYLSISVLSRANITTFLESAKEENILSVYSNDCYVLPWLDTARWELNNLPHNASSTID